MIALNKSLARHMAKTMAAASIVRQESIDNAQRRRLNPQTNIRNDNSELPKNLCGKKFKKG